jgi:Fic family protein
VDIAQRIQEIDTLKAEIDALRPINPAQEQRILQKFRLDWNYHSNAIEGNTLTYGETRAFLLHGITAQGKPFRDYLDIKGHKEAIDYLLDFIHQQEELTEAHIRELHRVLLVEPYDVPAMTADGFPTKRRIEIGRYKTAPNSVRTSTGEMHYYATPEETPALMGNLMKWYRSEKESLHPLLLAATFHYKFVVIHPFDDGNGRMSRLLMNLLLMQTGYVPAIIQTESKEEYLLALEQADSGEIEPFIELIAQNLLRSMQLYWRSAKGEAIDQIESVANFEQKIAHLQKRIDAARETSTIN